MADGSTRPDKTAFEHWAEIDRESFRFTNAAAAISNFSWSFGAL